MSDTRGSIAALGALPEAEESAEFALGADISSLLALEDSGVVFRDPSGTPRDLCELLAAQGVTHIRVRVWNHPYDAKGRGFGGGTMDVPRAVELGRRATAAGMGVLVNFHYSDFWADPAKQRAPRAWEGLDPAGVARAAGEFTREALTAFRDAGVNVWMVQVGNETTTGVAGLTRWEHMAAVFSAGAAAVREVTPHALVAVHVTNPEVEGSYARYAAQLDAAGVDYDVFASSYYPFWHGTLANLTAQLTHVATTYGKRVMVAETSWPHALTDPDATGTAIVTADLTTAYPISPAGQAQAFADVVRAVRAVGEAGIGVFYWEPAWLPVGPPEEAAANRVLWNAHGSGWASAYAGDYDPSAAGDAWGGATWANQALFAADGTPLSSLGIFAAQAPHTQDTQ